VKRKKQTNVNANGQRKPTDETSLNRFVRVPLSWLKPAMLNDKIYKEVDPNDPATLALVESMRRLGWFGAAAVTRDWVIVAGHRRRVSAQLAGITEVDVEKLSILSSDPQFPEYLVRYNEQRKKTPAEEIREQVALTDKKAAYDRLIAFRERESKKIHKRAEDAGLEILNPHKAKARSQISKAKFAMLDAAVSIINKYRSIWPLTLRQVHYRMLPLAVLRNSNDKKSVYVNDRSSYQDLSKLLVRARLTWRVSFDAIEDETRPQVNWNVWNNVGLFFREQLDGFLCGYRRNLQQSQEAHVLLFVEKMTVQAIAERAAAPFHVPLCVGRGYPSITAVHEMAEQFRRSGKDRMVLLIASDFDPEGESIADRLTACLRDEFDVENITPVKVALTARQAEEMNLPQTLQAKESSSRAAGFIEKHGRTVYELEAIEPDELQGIISDAIESVLDMKALRRERQREADDARELEARRKVALDAIGEH
jgi:hypothetical protein